MVRKNGDPERQSKRSPKSKRRLKKRTVSWSSGRTNGPAPTDRQAGSQARVKLRTEDTPVKEGRLHAEKSAWSKRRLGREAQQDLKVDCFRHQVGIKTDLEKRGRNEKNKNGS